MAVSILEKTTDVLAQVADVEVHVSVTFHLSGVARLMPVEFHGESVLVFLPDKKPSADVDTDKTLERYESVVYYLHANS